MITVADLKANNGLVIATHQDMIEQKKYVLKVGTNDDWAVYEGSISMDFGEIATNGWKVHDVQKIREMFAFDDEALKRRRP